MKARAHLYISGTVQGVFYRAFTREVARSLGLFGWGKNLFDGRVEAVFEGPKEKIESAITRCYAGPPSSRVTNIEVSWDEPLEHLREFIIRY
ncbi:MAG: acylphosphatase [Nitrospirales bacterium]|nr:acylphosphatase [Nitrospirales bacterium]